MLVSVVRPATRFTPAPTGLSHAEAATIPTAGLTAWRALVVDDGLKASDVVLVLGTGGVSIFALQIAKMMGATVIATSSSDEKLERGRAMGADLTINYRQHEDWGTRARDWTRGRGVDHVIELGVPFGVQPTSAPPASQLSLPFHTSLIYGPSAS
jgi:NADPH:quinone reductase-like Zn-dependent oxidoreductase